MLDRAWTFHFQRSMYFVVRINSLVYGYGEMNLVITVVQAMACWLVSINSLWPGDTIWQQTWVNIGSGKGLLPEGTKPMPELLLTQSLFTSIHASARGQWVNSLAPGRRARNFKIIIFKLIPWTDISGAACKIVVRWIPQNSIDDKSTLVQVMAWCRQATSHYLSQRWARSMLPYGITRPRWVKQLQETIKT